MNATTPHYYRLNRSLYPLVTILLVSFLIGCGNSDSKHLGLGPLEEFVFTGPVQGWSGSMEDGIYWLENQAGNPEDIRYFYTPSSPDGNGTRSAQVEVETADMDSNARAGLLYGYQDSPRFYYLIVASRGGTVDVYKRDSTGFNLSQSSSISAKGDTVHLEVRENGRELTVIIDGETIATLGNDNIGKGSLGIAAMGLGKFGFTNYEQTPSTDKPIAQSTPTEEPTKKIKRSAYLDYVDPQNGMVKFSVPFPKGWRYDNNPNDQLLLTGPNGTQVYETSSPRYVYSNDPFARQSAQQATGAQLAPLVPLDRYLQQQYAPYMQQRGYKLVNSIPIPKQVDILEIFAAGMPQGLSTKKFDALGAEWENPDGSKAFTLLTQSILYKQQFITWTVNAGELFASNSEYETAKGDFIYASLNPEFNPEWQIAANKKLLAEIMRSTQMWDERMKQSQIQHISRMNAILARGQSSSSVAKINSDILDISHAGYLKRSDMVSSGQAKSVDMLAEKSIISNPNTGELYRVDAGPQNNWVNADGIHFQTDNSLYDPRTDSSISDQQWERFDLVR